MVQQKNIRILILIIVILAAIVGVVYWWQTSPNEVKISDSTEIESTTNDLYSPSKELTEALELAENELRMSLFRGDAELAPTYKQFIVAVNNAQDDLEEAIELYYKEIEKNSPSEELVGIIRNLESINNKLNMSLLRGDAELAPTYEEFYKIISNIYQKLSEYMKAYRKL